MGDEDRGALMVDVEALSEGEDEGGLMEEGEEKEEARSEHSMGRTSAQGSRSGSRAGSTESQAKAGRPGNSSRPEPKTSSGRGPPKGKENKVKAPPGKARGGAARRVTKGTKSVVKKPSGGGARAARAPGPREAEQTEEVEMEDGVEVIHSAAPAESARDETASPEEVEEERSKEGRPEPTSEAAEIGPPEEDEAEPTEVPSERRREPHVQFREICAAELNKMRRHIKTTYTVRERIMQQELSGLSSGELAKLLATLLLGADLGEDDPILKTLTWQVRKTATIKIGFTAADGKVVMKEEEELMIKMLTYFIVIMKEEMMMQIQATAEIAIASFISFIDYQRIWMGANLASFGACFFLKEAMLYNEQGDALMAGIIDANFWTIMSKNKTIEGTNRNNRLRTWLERMKTYAEFLTDLIAQEEAKEAKAKIGTITRPKLKMDLTITRTIVQKRKPFFVSDARAAEAEEALGTEVPTQPALPRPSIPKKKETVEEEAAEEGAVDDNETGLYEEENELEDHIEDMPEEGEEYPEDEDAAEVEAAPNEEEAEEKMVVVPKAQLDWLTKELKDIKEQQQRSNDSQRGQGRGRGRGFNGRGGGFRGGRGIVRGGGFRGGRGRGPPFRGRGGGGPFRGRGRGGVLQANNNARGRGGPGFNANVNNNGKRRDDNTDRLEGTKRVRATVNAVDDIATEGTDNANQSGNANLNVNTTRGGRGNNQPRTFRGGRGRGRGGDFGGTRGGPSRGRGQVGSGGGGVFSRLEFVGNPNVPGASHWNLETAEGEGYQGKKLQQDYACHCRGYGCDDCV